MSSAEAGALNALGSDLAFSVSFSIAAELKTAADEAQMQDDELIALVLLISIILSAVPRALTIAGGAVSRWMDKLWASGVVGAKARRAATGSGDAGGDVEDEGLPKMTPAISQEPGGRDIIGFLKLVVEIGQRIAMSLTIQLVAASVSTRQPLRIVRILTLFSVAIFFLFLQSGAAVILAPTSESKKNK
jgi:hypothetical protein